MQKTISEDCYFHNFLGIMDAHHTEYTNVEMSNNWFLDHTIYSTSVSVFWGNHFVYLTNSKKTQKRHTSRLTFGLFKRLPNGDSMDIKNTRGCGSFSKKLVRSGE